MMTMDSTLLNPHTWHKFARMSYNFLKDTIHKGKYPTYEDWLKVFNDKCNKEDINVFSGRALYSTLLPENFNWKMKSCEVKNGILISGNLESKTISGDSSSLGMVMYRVYGSHTCIEWLNASYNMLNEYLIYRGLTLGFPHVELSPSQQKQVDQYIENYKKRKDLLMDVDTIEDDVLRARKEIEITQELNNVRESIAVIVMKPNDPNITLNFKGKVKNVVTLSIKKYKVLDNSEILGTIVPLDDNESIEETEEINTEEVDDEEEGPEDEGPEDEEEGTTNPDDMFYDDEEFEKEYAKYMKQQEAMEKMEEKIAKKEEKKINKKILIDNNVAYINNEPDLPDWGEWYNDDDGNDVYEFEGSDENNEGEIDIDLYRGIIKYTYNEKTYNIPMSIAYRIQCKITITVLDKEEEKEVEIDVDREYKIPNQLLMMIESGARGNATNAIQISGIIGQQSYENGRIPRMIGSTSINVDGNKYSGARSLPCYVPGENSPDSRGFISESYVQGMKPDGYFQIHVASRENLTSNQDLTPQTGYFSRRVRTFTENLQIKKVEGKLAVVNERDIIVMMDYIFDPSRMFKYNNIQTFVDMNYEIDNIRKQFTNTATYISIPFLSKMSNYIKYDDVLRETINLNTDNIVLAVDPRIYTTYPDYYKYLKNELPRELNRNNIIVVTIPSNISERKQKYWYMALTNYDSITVVPIFSSGDVGRSFVNKHPIENDVSAYIDIITAGINRVSYGTKPGNELSRNVIYHILKNGSDFENYPMVIRSNKRTYDLLDQYTLFEALILTGKVKAIKK